MLPDKTRHGSIPRWLFLLAIVAVAHPPAFADDAPLPGSAPSLNQGSLCQPASAAAASEPAPTGAASGNPASAAPPVGVGPGPLSEARKVLFNRLMLAKKEGIGIGAYMAEFARIEEAARNGDAPESLQPRIASLARSLKEQLDRRQILKTQRPVPSPGTGSSADSSQQPPSAGSGAAGGGGDRTAAIIDKLKEKLKDGDIPDGLKEKFLNSDQGRKILEKLGR